MDESVVLKKLLKNNGFYDPSDLESIEAILNIFDYSDINKNEESLIMVLFRTLLVLPLDIEEELDFFMLSALGDVLREFSMESGIPEDEMFIYFSNLFGQLHKSPDNITIMNTIVFDRLKTILGNIYAATHIE